MHGVHYLLSENSRISGILHSIDADWGGNVGNNPLFCGDVSDLGVICVTPFLLAAKCYQDVDVVTEVGVFAEERAGATGVHL